MANQPEASEWPAGVFQLESNTPALGGEGGPMNLPLLQLANRTRFLKEQLEAPAGSALLAAVRRLALPAGKIESWGRKTPPAYRLEARGDRTLGGAASGATHAGDDYRDLWDILWGDWPAAACPIYVGGTLSARGASAAADWAAGKRLALPELRAEFLRGWDNGRGLDTDRAFGTWQRPTLAPISDDTTDNWDLPQIAGGARNFGTDPFAPGDYPALSGHVAYRTQSTADSAMNFIADGNLPNWIGATRPRNVAVLMTITY